MDRKNLLFHIKSNDYFGTLATVLDLTNQEIARRGFRNYDAEVIDRMKDDLVYLQRRYVITPKKRAKPSRMRRDVK